MGLPESIDEIDHMKYADLQKLAKDVGIKANMKAAKLVQALKECYSDNEKKEDNKKKENNKKSEDIQQPEDKEGPDCSNQQDKEEADEESEKENCAKPKQKKSKKGRKGSKRSSNDKTETDCTADVQAVAPKTPVQKPATPESTKDSRPPTPDLLVQGIKMTPVPTPVKNKTPGSTAGRKRKRTKTPETKANSTFDVEKSPEEKPILNETYEHEAKKRRGTFEIERTSPAAKEVDRTSPGAKEIVETLTSNMDAEQMKASIMDAIEKKVQKKKSAIPTTKTESSQIPRFAAFLAKQKQENGASTSKPITPGNKDWAKIHKRNFDKMESIDTYLAKKRKRTETITASVKKAKLLAEQTKHAVATIKNHRTPTHKGAKIVRPVKPCSGFTFKSPVHSGVPFVPSVTSTSRMNLNFGALKTPSFSAVKVKKPMTSAMKSTGRRSPRLNNDESKENTDRKKSLGGTLTSATPLKLNTTQSPPKKQVFDLKASLSKPLSWKPHTGKLQSWSQKADFKTRKPQTKEDRLKAAKTARADKKFNSAMQRRKIVA